MNISIMSPESPTPEPEQSASTSPDAETKVDTEPALDERWYSRLRELSTSKLYSLETTEAEQAEQKADFLAGEIRNPHFYYFKVNPEVLQTREVGLIALKSQIKAEEPNETVRQAYLWTINESIASNRMIAQIGILNGYTELLNNPNSTESERASYEKLKDNAMRRFKRYSEFIYGAPSEDIFEYSAEKYTKLADSLADHEDISVSLAAHRVKQVFSGIHQKEGAELPPITEQAFATIHEHSTREQGDIINFDEFDGKVDRETLIQIFAHALDGVGATKFGFKLATDNPNQKIFSVNQGRKEVNVPPGLAPLYKRLRELIIHEIGTHVTRRVHGERSKLKLLGFGLDRYDKGEEGMATAREQSVNEYDNSIDYTSLERHTAISLARGLDGKPRDFRDVFTIMRDVHFLNKIAGGSKLSIANRIADNNAWLNATRTFRGTDHDTPGVCFTKDIAYSEGNVATWRLVDENPLIVNLFLLGKLDIANPRHIEILVRLGITDEDLHILSS